MGIVMPNSTVFAGTPYYVLMEGNHRIGPKVVPLQSGDECLPIYGFSDKEPYDTFCRTSQVALKPYPLVKHYLQNQANTLSTSLKLVVIDAAGPREPCLHAATMEAVLEAQQKRTPEVGVTHRLKFDEEVGAYRLEVAVT